ncbi:alkaline phosphatase PhoX [Vreelandella utahensis]|uniref:alkaline phosphatase PhoX n=1 Tax=Vreelandella halophila TaxID=86177 RepID=UPI000985E9F0|nr:alkaline phosphatase PhoX [Halomonas utahensis]
MYKDFHQLIDHVSQEIAVTRRDFVKSGTAATAAFAALGGQSVAAAETFSSDYGPLQPVADKVTGLELLELPEGFEYITYGWHGQVMSDDTPTSGAHDGMSVVAARGNEIAIVRNHENSAGDRPAVMAPNWFDDNEAGGTSNLIFDTVNRKFVASWSSLGGTIRNCAGGRTPWGTWISCEETTAEGHGWVFEVPGFGVSDARPIRAAGRFSHEAVAIDPATGIMYETEDARPAGFYRFRPEGKWGDLHSGGTLEALAVKDQPGFVFGDNGRFPSFADGTSWDVEWVPVNDPMAEEGSALESAPGAATFTRLEGCWEDSGRIFFSATDGGSNRTGQLYEYDPRRQKLTMIYESRSASDLDSPDNIAVSPRGGLLVCEDGGQAQQRLIAVNRDATVFPFARNRISLNNGDVATIDSHFPGAANHIGAGDYRGREWAGATFYNRWLFVNIQDPGVTFAITGPWEKGSL